VLGTLLLSVLAGHRRYAHVTALRCDAVNPPLLLERNDITAWRERFVRALSTIETQR
jgi:hypothetical protein